MLPIIRPHRLVRLDPSDTCNHFPRFWDNLFNDVAPQTKMQSLGNLDLYEDEKNLYAEVELPGFNRNQFEITLEEDVLNLSAERILENQESQDNYFVKERRQGKWSRTLKLPVAISEKNVHATYQDGLLKITLKKQPETRTHKIEVK